MTIVIAMIAGSLAVQLPVPFEPARTGPMQPVNDPSPAPAESADDRSSILPEPENHG